MAFGYTFLEKPLGSTIADMVDRVVATALLRSSSLSIFWGSGVSAIN